LRQESHNRSTRGPGKDSRQGKTNSRPGKGRYSGNKRQTPGRPAGAAESKEPDRKWEKGKKDHTSHTSLRPANALRQEVKASEEMPLNKYIASCGICSRRKAAELVRQEKVAVNGHLVKEPATRVTGKEEITLEGKRISQRAEMIYVLLNKPRGYITTVEDPEGRKTVMELVRDVGRARIYPVGRLDRNTSGLLLLTNDGALAQKLAHPSYEAKKVYHAVLDKPLSREDFKKILTGVELEDGMASVDAMEYVEAGNLTEVGLEIHSGKNRIVRRIFESLGYSVEKLDRVMYAGLTKKQIPRGRWRMLTEKEVILLKHFGN
jgi:23S rRNA pseudouridine2605 synthase